MIRNLRAGLLLLGLLAGCDDDAADTLSPTQPPSSPSATADDFSEQWCLAVEPFIRALDDAPYLNRDRQALSDTQLAIDSMERLVSDLQDAGLSQEAADVRELAARIGDWRAVLAERRGPIDVDSMIEILDEQREASKGINKPLNASVDALGACP